MSDVVFCELRVFVNNRSYHVQELYYILQFTQYGSLTAGLWLLLLLLLLLFVVVVVVIIIFCFLVVMI